MTCKIIPEKCVSCGVCVGMCPANAIVAAAGKYEIDPELCVNCSVCIGMCPANAIVKEEPSCTGACATCPGACGGS